jgi:hypothetical protein
VVFLNDEQVVREIGILHEMKCSPSAPEDVPNLLVAERHVETHFGLKRKVDIYLIYSDYIFNEILVRTLMQGGECQLTKRTVVSIC